MKLVRANERHGPLPVLCHPVTELSGMDPWTGADVSKWELLPQSRESQRLAPLHTSRTVTVPSPPREGRSESTRRADRNARSLPSAPALRSRGSTARLWRWAHALLSLLAERAARPAAAHHGRVWTEEEGPGLKRKFWGRRRCWGFTESTQNPFRPSASPLFGSGTCQTLPAWQRSEGKRHKDLRALMAESNRWRKGEVMWRSTVQTRIKEAPGMFIFVVQPPHSLS